MFKYIFKLVTGTANCLLSILSCDIPIKNDSKRGFNTAIFIRTDFLVYH